jgi:hypothetical protein
MLVIACTGVVALTREHWRTASSAPRMTGERRRTSARRSVTMVTRVRRRLRHQTGVRSLDARVDGRLVRNLLETREQRIYTRGNRRGPTTETAAHAGTVVSTNAAVVVVMRALEAALSCIAQARVRVIGLVLRAGSTGLRIGIASRKLGCVTCSSSLTGVLCILTLLQARRQRSVSSGRIVVARSRGGRGRRL